MKERDFPSSAVVENLPSPAGDGGLDPWSGNAIPQQPSVHILQLKALCTTTEDFPMLQLRLCKIKKCLFFFFF